MIGRTAIGHENAELQAVTFVIFSLGHQTILSAFRSRAEERIASLRRTVCLTLLGAIVEEQPEHCASHGAEQIHPWTIDGLGSLWQGHAYDRHTGAHRGLSLGCAC